MSLFFRVINSILTGSWMHKAPTYVGTGQIVTGGVPNNKYNDYNNTSDDLVNDQGVVTRGPDTDKQVNECGKVYDYKTNSFRPPKRYDYASNSYK